MIRVTHDHFDHKPCDIVVEAMPLYGMERMMGLDDSIPNGNLPTVKFKLFDDDDVLMASGELTDDDECVNQQAALRWGETMFGCTVVKVKRNNKYVQEIS